MQWAPSYRANVGDSGYAPTANLKDGSHATYEEVTGTGVDSGISAYYDLGPTPAAVRKLECRFVHKDSTTVILEYSSNGTAWTEFTGGTSPTSGVCVDQTLDRNPDAGAGNTVTARYWRASCLSELEDCADTKARITEFRLLDNALAYISEPAPEESVGARFGLRAGQTDVLETDTLVEVVSARFGMRAAIYTATPSIVHQESPEARFGMRAGSTATGQEWLDTLAARFALRAEQVEEFLEGHIAAIMYEFPEARFGMRPAISVGQVISVDSPAARFAMRSSQVDQEISVDSPAGRFGMFAGLDAFQVYANDTVSARFGLRAGLLDESIMFDGIGARFGMRSVATPEQLIALDSPMARMAMRSAEITDLIVFTEIVEGRLAMFAALVDPAITVDSPGSRIGMRAAQTEWVESAESPSARMGMKSSASEQREIIDVVSALFGMRSAAPEEGISLEAPAARMGMRPFVVELTDGARLIPNIRSVVRATLPEVNQIPESMTDAVEDQDLTLPYVILNAQAPRADSGFAVQDEAVWVDVDLIYVDKNVKDSLTDNPERIRKRLDLAVRALLMNYRQKGAADANPTAITTELVATPMERAQGYQEYFIERGDDVVVQTATVSCLTIMNLAGV